MGVVVLAHHLGLDERVAIKFLTADVALEPRTVERFLREGRAAVKIRGEHVARMMDVGTLEDGSPFLVMEYLEGQELAAKLKEGPLPAELALSLVMQTCEALAEAHALGIVHRDLKPANLFLDFRPDRSVRVKVLDFGISKVTFDDASAGTTSATVLGTPQYMSPEQLRSTRDVNARTDIWSLGVILYELLTAKHPFAGPTVPQVFANILEHAPVPLRQYAPDVSPEIERIVAVCLQKDASKRYPDVAALAHALASAGAPDGPRAAERVGRILTSTSTGPRTPHTPEAPSAPRESDPGPPATIAFGVTEPQHRAPESIVPRQPRLRGVWLVTAGALVAAGVGAVFVAARMHRPGSHPAERAASTFTPSAPMTIPEVPPSPSTASSSESAPSLAASTTPTRPPPPRTPRRRPQPSATGAPPAVGAGGPAPAQTSEDRR
jgi:serine/threonine-protein kinase